MHKDLKRIANQCRRNTMKLSQERIRDANNTQLNTKTTKWRDYVRKILNFSSMVEFQSSSPLTLTQLSNYDCQCCFLSYILVHCIIPLNWYSWGCLIKAAPQSSAPKNIGNLVAPLAGIHCIYRYILKNCMFSLRPKTFETCKSPLKHNQDISEKVNDEVDQKTYVEKHTWF